MDVPAKLVQSIVRTVCQAADAYRSVFTHLEWLHGSRTLHLANKYIIDCSAVSRVLLLGIGKAAVPMTRAVLDVIKESFDAAAFSGLVLTKYGHVEGQTGDLERYGIKVREAGHPQPDENGHAAAKELLALAKAGPQSSLILFLVSGGGSALAPLPVETVSLSDMQATNQRLLACGASIDEINCIRKHLSQISAGQLARSSVGTIVTLALSDVVGDRPDVIASGPTVPDTSTFADCKEVILKYGLEGMLPSSVVSYIRRGLVGEVCETPKTLPQVGPFVLVGSNKTVLASLRGFMAKNGYPAVVLSSCIHGEAKEIASVFAAILHSVDQGDSTMGPPPLAIIAGGETTVTLSDATSNGKGGRNQELALAFAVALQHLQGTLASRRAITFMSLGTDGTDGPTDAAGAYVTHNTYKHAVSLGLQPERYLREHDAYTFFSQLGKIDTGQGGLIMTGPTGTNVMDVMVMTIT